MSSKSRSLSLRLLRCAEPAEVSEVEVSKGKATINIALRCDKNIFCFEKFRFLPFQ